MAEYLSGRSRRIIVTGRWQSPIRVEWRCTREWPVAPNRYATFSEAWPESIEVRALGMKVEYWPSSGFGSFPADNACTVTLTGQYTVNQRITLGEGLSFETTDSDSNTTNYTVGDEEIFDFDPQADYSFWADVEEWFEVIDPIEDSDADGFPNCGGDAVKDGISGRSIRFFERLQMDGEMGVSVTGLAPLTLTRTILSGDVSEFGEVDHSLDRRGSIHAENATALLSITGTAAGLDVEPNYMRSTSTASFDATTGFDLELTKGLNESGESYGFCWGVPDIKFKWQGAIFAGSDQLEEPFQIEFERRFGSTDLIDISGSATEEWSQKAFEAFCVLDGSSQDSVSFDNRTPIRHWLTGESLAENRDQVDDWRMQFRGRKWTAFTVEHAEETVLDDGDSLAGWSGENVELSLDESVRIAVEEGGIAIRTFTPPVASEAYRYLEIEARSLTTEQAPATITIGSKSWIRKTGDAEDWVTWTIDLCQPGTTWVDIDEKESRYPLDEFGEVTDSEHWGVSLIKQIEFSNLLGGETYEIRKIALVRKGEAKLSFLPAFRQFRLRQQEETDELKVGVWSEVDGRIADLPSMRKTGATYSWVSISDLTESLSGLGGWIITPGTLPSDGYHTNGLEAELAWGAGVIADDGSLLNGVDLLCTDAKGIFAQALWDSVEVYPGAGDVWFSSGEFGAETELFSAKILRSQSWGLILGESAPRSGALVQLLLDDELRGEDTTNARGWFTTGLPGGLEGSDHFVKRAGTSTDDFSPITRWRHRWVLHELSVAGSVSYDWHLAGLAARASVTGSGIELAIKNNGFSAEYSHRLLEYVASSLAIRWDLGRELKLILVTEEEGQIKERTSLDLGENWGMAETLATGNVRYPALTIHPDGRRFVYWIEDGAVNGVIRDRSGAVLQSVTEARIDVEESGLAVGTLDQTGGNLAIELITIEGDSVVISLSSDGVEFG
ncbi:MAG: hypothetical protein KF824_05805 [Fimbriimonadaceae bacterium]|nr:MAG: hypothetical protein KF824_05805 [Fimbriimonadaceae bacterium]